MRLPEKDTALEIETWLHRQLAERSGVERLRMACDMFDAATALIAASLPRSLAVDSTARRIAVIRRLYWPERNDPLITSALAALGARKDA